MSAHTHNTFSKEEVQKALLSKGIRFTKKKAIILDELLRSDEHLTIDQVLSRAKKKDERIGYVTVYRTLKLLKECGFVNQWQFGDGFSRFEKTGDHHDHLICLNCKKILEFEEEKIEKLQEQVAKQFSFKVMSHIHEIYGYCKECQKK